MLERDYRRRVRRAIVDFAFGLAVVMAVFGLAVMESRASVPGPDVRVAGTGLEMSPQSGMFVARSGAGLFAGPIGSDEVVVARYSASVNDGFPWFMRKQPVRAAHVPGTGVFLVMAVGFALMSALTMGLWRMLGQSMVAQRGGRRLR